MQDIALTEAGILFVSADGFLTLHGRSRLYDPTTATALTVPVDSLGPDARISNGAADIVNDVTVTRTNGATIRVYDDDSIDEYGVMGDTLTVVSYTDADAVDRANWVLATKSEPVVKLPQVTLDGMTDPDTSAAVRSLLIGSRVAVTGLPTQAPRSTEDLRVQGYSESIGMGGWSVTANTTPWLTVPPLKLDDASYGVLDADNHLVY